MKTYKFHFREKESDITIISDFKSAITKAKSAFYHHRDILEKYIAKNENFFKSFSPVSVDSTAKIITLMADAASIFDVGPMAAVAGALADLMVEAMKKENDKGIAPKVALVENGGEIAIDSEKSMKIALYAGYNDLNLNVGFLIEKKNCPIGIGTSSATIGHAVSLGEADAVTVFAENATLGDTAATKIANLVKGEDIEKSIKAGLDAADDLPEIRGVFINRENKIGSTGKIPKMIKVEGNKKDLISRKVEDIAPQDFEIFK
ncbi:MAG: UPF0280 family protein [Candidatus Lokiarchaeota archaeon]|nr:UPF0280 family protein [Candidatus Lokiarchaeota archaeon]